ncbi:hypothetical protein TRFO_24156 [Tritrichomonas foetus]|uniref:Cullin family profile domain-containing protein n=1 Tax=Tritrichomonas foetus TaxID=1144522 RepID=A0A1J4KD18_9EUKA|nr:hypothetical protein TRFO_24156 [Tritrichomonas foetus]|eukprot:OHT07596.1 hypothetical protein TRFO_24156 [Tritrichomonas foetus]
MVLCVKFVKILNSQKMMTSNFLTNFINSILCDPAYSPDPDTYLGVIWEVYDISTLHPIHDPDTNPFEHPFEVAYLHITGQIKELFQNQIMSELIESRENRINQIYSFIRRMKITNHIFRYINKHRHTFIHKTVACKVAEYISNLYFGVLESNFDDLVNVAISSLNPIMIEGNQEKADFTLLESLIYLINSAAAGYKVEEYESFKLNPEKAREERWSTLYNEYVNEKIMLKLNEFFETIAKETENALPLLIPGIVDKVFNFTKKLKNIHTRNLICDILYNNVVENEIITLNNALTSKRAIDIIINKDNEYSLERKYLSSLTYHPKSLSFVQHFFSRFMDNFIEPLEKEVNIKNLGLLMLKFLDYINDFKTLAYEDIYVRETESFVSFMEKEISNKLKVAKFHQKFGGNYQVVLAFIVDAYLKRGNSFKNTVQAQHMIKLLSYAEERDIFITHHTNNLFVRTATRSTTGLTYEKTFLNKIAEFINEENLAKSYSILEAAKQEEVFNSKFSYFTIKRQLAPLKRNYPSFPLPKDYQENVEKVSAELKKKHPNYEYEWLHYLGTANLKLQTEKGISYLTTSVAQVSVLNSLIKVKKIPFSDLASLVGIDQAFLEVIIRTLSNAKLVILEGGEKGKINTNTIIFNNKYHMPKAIITDNWTPKVIKVRNLDLQRSKCAQAAIVRIMKQNRMMKTQQLMEIVINELSRLFPITINDIQSCIRELISDEYLEEKEDSHLAYRE